MTIQDLELATVTFTIPSGAGGQAYGLYPGACLDAEGSNEVWLGSCVIEKLMIGVESVAGGMLFAIHDYRDATGRIAAGGTTSQRGRLTVTGAGAIRTAPGGGAATFECFGTNRPAAFTANNKLAEFVASEASGVNALAGTKTFEPKTLCQAGAAILYTGGAALAAAQRVVVVYRPLSYGWKRKTLGSNSSRNAGAIQV